MNLPLKKLLSLGLVCTLSISMFGLKGSAIAKEKEPYLIMKTNEVGGYDITTEELTAMEAANLRKAHGVAIVEKDGTVQGSEADNSEQIGFSEIDQILENKDAHEMLSEELVINNDTDDTEWNMEQINAENVNQQNSVNAVTGSAIKVCMIDSGVDYNTDTDVYLRKNFIPNEDDISIIYEDLCGHGTSVAGIIAAKDNEEGITGINSNVILYSARVLDSSCSAPISRVVEAIYWAIDQGVDIINISFGTTTNSTALRKAIKDAYNEGILIVAASGNKGTVEYPAAYDEVMAIGSVDSQGQASDFSPTNDKIELVAPGELILSTGDFGGVSVHSGTSLAAPHITGIASVLWQKDSSVSASFIRALLDASANLYGNKEEYGYGLVDLDYALGIYDEFKANYNQASLAKEDMVDNTQFEAVVTDISDNTNVVETFDDITYVEGSWGKNDHETLATSSSILAIKAGATANDRYIAGMTTYPQWHGYWQKKPNGNKLYESNYMAAYIYLTNIAQVWNSTSTSLVEYSDPASIMSVTSNDTEALRGVVSSTGFNGVPWETSLRTKDGTALEVNNSNIKYYLYGVAMHSATDIFAHSTYTLNGNYINHTAGSNAWDAQADVRNYIVNRYSCASNMARLVVEHATSDTSGTVEDFCTVINNTYNDSFYLKNFISNAESIDLSYVSQNRSTFARVDLAANINNDSNTKGN